MAPIENVIVRTMPIWRRWINRLAFLVWALVLAWNFSYKVQPHSKHTLVFSTTLLLILCGGGLSLLDNRRFVALKVFYAVVVGVFFRYFKIGFDNGGVADILFFFAVALVFVSLRPHLEEWERFRRPWWPAFKRTIRRAKGDWREDEARLAEKVLGENGRKSGI